MPRRKAEPGTLAPGWLVAILMWMGAVSVLGVDFPLRWRWSNPAPHGNNIIGMAYAPPPNQLGVQVAERGQIYTSDDLIFWIPRESGTISNLRSVAFLGARIVVVGENGTALYADDINDFRPGTLIDGPTADWLEGVAASPTLAVAVGDNGAIYHSSDGINWKRRVTVHTDWFKSIAWGGGVFVAVGDGGAVLTSPNGTNWTRRTSGTMQNLSRVAFGTIRFTAVGAGGVVISTTNGGTNWVNETTTVGATHPLYTTALGPGARMVAGESEVRLQESGGAFSDEIAKTNGPPDWTYLSSINRPNYFLLGGRAGLMVEGYKTNATPYFWIRPENSVRSWLFDVAYASNIFVAVGDLATVMTSGSGVEWNLELVPPAVTNSIFFGVGGTSNLLVAVGTQGSVIVSPNVITNYWVTNGGIVTNITSSLFGVVWHAVPRPTTNDLQGVAAFAGGYIITGDKGNVFTSADGTNWVAQTTPTNRILSGVASFPGGLVATGDRGTIITSADGSSWTLRTSGTTNWLYRVRYLGGQLVAVGQNGVILTSGDGVDWTARANGNNNWLHDVVYVAGTWFAVGKQGTFLSSSNLVDWVGRGAITLKSLYGAATDAQRLITIGVEGVILRSQIVPDLTPVEVLAYSRIVSTNMPGVVQNLFLFGGKTDQRFAVEYCSALETNNWLEREQLEFLDPAGTLYYLETLFATNTPPKDFYRAVLLP